MKILIALQASHGNNRKCSIINFCFYANCITAAHSLPEHLVHICVREFPGKLAPAITRSHTGSLTRQRKHEVRLLREFLVRRTRQLPVLLLYSIKKTTGHKLSSCRETWTTRAILPPPHDAHGLHTHRGLARA
jgi:hypothetical protein